MLGTSHSPITSDSIHVTRSCHVPNRAFTRAKRRSRHIEHEDAMRSASTSRSIWRKSPPPMSMTQLSVVIHARRAGGAMPWVQTETNPFRGTPSSCQSGPNGLWGSSPAVVENVDYDVIATPDAPGDGFYAGFA